VGRARAAVVWNVAMASTRKTIRHRRRFRATVGTTPVFTLDVGPGGFSAELMRVVPSGTPIKGSIRLNGIDVGYEGQIVWVRPGDPHINLRGKIGVRFTSLPAEVKRLLEASALKGVV
jgi:hypothetical protein